MNNLDNIFKLIDAGYSKEEINELLNPEVEAEASEEAPAEDDKPQVDLSIFKSLSEELVNLKNNIKELDTSIKKGNILNSSLNLPKEQTAEDILASILTPEPKNKGGIN